MHALLNVGAAIDAVDAQQQTAIHLAARSGHTSVLEVLLGAGAAASPALLNAADAEGRTAVNEASHFGHTAALQVLLAAGATVNGVDAQGP